MKSRLTVGILGVVLLRVLASAQEVTEQALVIESVTASAFQDPNAPEHTVDDTLDTRWSAEGLGQWIAYELYPGAYVSAVEIAFYRGNERGASFDLHVSEAPCADEAVWRNGFVRYVQSSGLTLDLQRFDVSPRQATCVVLVGGGNDLNLRASLTEVRVVGKPTTPPNAPEPVDMATGIAPLVPLEAPVYAVSVPGGSVQLTHRFGTRQLSAYVATQRLFGASADDLNGVDVCALEGGKTVAVARQLEVTEGVVTLVYERPILSAYVQEVCAEMVIRVYRPQPGETELCSGELVLETGPLSYRAATIAPAFD